MRETPNVQWHQYDPLHCDAAHDAAMQMFGRPVSTVYDLSQAQVIVSLDAEFMVSMPGSLAYSRQFADGRRVRGRRRRRGP